MSPENHNEMQQVFPDVLARIGPAVRAGKRDEHLDQGTERSARMAGPLRALVVTSRPAWRKRVLGAALAAGMVCQTARSAAEARAMLAALSVTERSTDGRATSEIEGFDVVVIDIDLPDGSGLDLVDGVRRMGGEAVLSAKSPRVEDVLGAMRLGACDVLERDGKSTPEVGERVAAAAARSRNQKLQQQRISALRRMCRRLNSSRREVVRQVDALCSDLLVAYQEVTEHMNQVSTAAEFKGLIKGELDIEALLRTTLEFVLSKSGPTNAAVFLPTTSGDYSLGAYVNYDCPKDTCDVLLDHLANVIAPRFERTTGLIHLTTPEQLEQYVADEADWLSGSGVVGFACRHDGEVLAIFLLFRDRKAAFAQNILDQVKTVGELFAAQLARVIHIHHRHLPKDKWGSMGDPNEGREDDYGDLAA